MAAAFVAPAALVVLLIVIVPLGRALWMSLFHIVLTRPGVEPFVGLDNYIEQLTSPDFWAATWPGPLLHRGRRPRSSSRSGSAWRS